MSKDMNDYRQGDTIYILLKKIQAESVMNEWLEGNWQCDLTQPEEQRLCGAGNYRPDVCGTDYPVAHL